MRRADAAMKVHIHPRREWRQPGKATGKLRCKLVMPAIDDQLTRYFQLKPTDRIGIVTTFVRRNLPLAEAFRSDGSFTLDIQVRAANLGVRWRRLARWVSGEDLELLFRQVSQRWIDWPKEISHDRDEEDVEMADAIVKLRGGRPTRP
jgi:hypothetical protein